MLLIPAHQATAKAQPGCAAGGVKIKADASPATVTLNNTTTNIPVQVVVAIAGTTFAITPVDSSVTLTSASWCLKASTQTQNGAGATGTSTIANKKGVAQKISFLVVYGVTSSSFVDPVGSCWASPIIPSSDLRYDGPINTRANSVQSVPSDANCAGSTSTQRTVVRAPDVAGARVLCQQLTGFSDVINSLNGLGYESAPADFWMCAMV